MSALTPEEQAHLLVCRCAECRHARFNPGPASTSRKRRRVVNHRDTPRKHPPRVGKYETATRKKRYTRWRKARRKIGAKGQ